MSTTIRIYYYNNVQGEMNRWNLICARAIEMFGLPGDRFTTSLCNEHMDFIFKNNKDAMMFAIEHNGEFISDSDLATEHFSKYLQ